MSGPSGSTPEPDGLAAALESTFGPSVVIGAPVRLTGGASRETWAFTANGEELILRRDPPGRASAPHVMGLEAAAMRACRRAGLAAPEVLVHDDGSHLGTAGLVMRRIAGETIARRIQRDERFAGARRHLVAELGEFLGGLHRLDPGEIDGIAERDTLADMRERYAAFDHRSVVFDQAFDWLIANRPAPTRPAVVHGDFRLGNVIVGPEGLAAVIDWELVRLGDPHEDLAWLCLRAWRFGQAPEVAGLGSLDELVGAYEAAGGRPVDPDRLHWWLVDRTLLWGIGCMAQEAVHRSGAVRSVDLAATGRRVAEQEWDLIELLAPDAWAAARAAPPPATLADDEAPFGRPTARELLEAVREFLHDDVVSGADPRLVYPGRVAANIVAQLERELAQVAVVRPGTDWETLALVVRDKLAVVNPAHLAGPRLPE